MGHRPQAGPAAFPGMALSQGRSLLRQVHQLGLTGIGADAEVDISQAGTDLAEFYQLSHSVRHVETTGRENQRWSPVVAQRSVEDRIVAGQNLLDGRADDDARGSEPVARIINHRGCVGDRDR
jgi:hypothetical protein